MKLYQRIKQRREELGLSQDDLAKRMGYRSRSTIAKIESGKNDIPQSKIAAFAKALDTTPAILMGFENIEPSDSDEDWKTAEVFVYKNMGIEYINKFLHFDCSEIINTLSLLNDKGKNEAQTRIKELSFIPKYQLTDSSRIYDFSNIISSDKDGIYRVSKEGVVLKAAHKRTDIAESDEEIQSDIDMMSDENF